MPSQGNIISILALLAWVPLALWIARRWPPAKAAALLFIVPALILPQGVAFKLPGIVEFDKDRIAILWLLVGLLLFHRQRLRSLRLGKWVTFSIVLALGGSVVTVFLNQDVIVRSAIFLPSHTPYDAVHALASAALDYILPFALAAAAFRGRADLRLFLRILVGAGLAYSLLQIVELVLSPQLHRWLYGFHQHSFAQAMRGGGYRPVVLMSHGLAVAMFTFSALLAAAGSYKAKLRGFRFDLKWVAAFLWLILFASKSQAALLYSLIAVPLILWMSPKLQLRVALVAGVVLLLYPVARGADLVPVDDIRSWVASEYGEEKVSSIMMRFDNEEVLLERANERPIFGWGGYCRPCVLDEITGEPSSVADGDWVITLGTSGYLGFLGKYLLLVLPILFAARRLKFIRSASDRRLIAALALIVGFSAFDLLPNGNFNYLVFVFAGVLLGCTGGILREQAAAASRAAAAKAAAANAPA